MKRKPKTKPLTPDKFKQKVEASLWSVNQAIIALQRELNSLQCFAENQMEVIDASTKETVAEAKLYDAACDIQMWAEAMDEVVEGIDTASITQKLKKPIFGDIMMKVGTYKISNPGCQRRRKRRNQK